MKVSLHRAKSRDDDHYVKVRTKHVCWYRVPWASEDVLEVEHPDLWHHEEVIWDGYIYLRKDDKSVRFNPNTKRFEVLNVFMERYDMLLFRFSAKMLRKHLAKGFEMYAPIEWFHTPVQIPAHEEI